MTAINTNSIFEVTNDMLSRSVVSTGNTARLAAAFHKAKAGKPLTVGVIGGSITGGAAASSNSNCYGYKYCEWWKNTFSQSDISFVNAGIGATGSLFGVGRVENDLLSFSPDVVVVEFAVNDTNSDTDTQCYESLIRKILLNNNSTAIIMLFMVCADGSNAEECEIPLGRHYSLPMISYRSCVYPEILGGKLSWGDISPDDIHPNDLGHEIAAKMLTNYTEKLYSEIDSLSSDIPVVPQPLFGDTYKCARFFTPENMSPISSGGFEIIDMPFYNMKKGLRTNSKDPSPIIYSFTAKKIILFFRKSVEENAGCVDINIDGEFIMSIDSSFPGGWGSYCASQVLLDTDTISAHVLSVTPRGGEFSFWGIMTV